MLHILANTKTNYFIAIVELPSNDHIKANVKVSNQNFKFSTIRLYHICDPL